MTAFDPYYHWLSIPPSEQPAHYYRLLGIPLFEGDEDVILNAANRQVRYVISQSVKAHRAAAQQILNELSRAKDCLLDRDAKRAYDDALRAHVAPYSGEVATTVSPPQQVETEAPIIVPKVVVSRSGRRSFGIVYWIGHAVAGLIGLGIAYAILVRTPLWNKPSETANPPQEEIRLGNERAVRDRMSAVESKDGLTGRPVQHQALTPELAERTDGLDRTESDSFSEQEAPAPRPADPRKVVARFPRMIALSPTSSGAPIKLASLDGLHAVRLELEVAHNPNGQYTAREKSTSSDLESAAWAIVDASDRTVAEIVQDRSQVTFCWNPATSESDVALFSLGAICFRSEGESLAMGLREPVAVDPLRIGPRHIVPIPLQLPESIWDQLRYEVAVSTPLPSEFQREPKEFDQLFGYPTTFRAGAEDDVRVEITVQPIISNNAPVIRLAGEYFLGKSRERPLDRDRFKKHLQEVSSTLDEKLQDRIGLVQQNAQLASRMNLVQRATPKNAIQAAAKATTLSGLNAGIRKNNERLASLDRTIERFKADQEALIKVNRWIDLLSFDGLLHFRIYLPLQVHGDVHQVNLATSSPIPTVSDSDTHRGRPIGGLEETEGIATLEEIDSGDDSIAPQAIERIGPKIVPPPEQGIGSMPHHEALLARAAWAMSNADVELARQSLNEAATLSPSSEYLRKVERLKSLLGGVEQFWGAVGEGIQLISNSELRVKGETVYITQVENGRITFKQAGRLRRIRQDSLPPEFALAIADRFFDPDAPSTDVIRGAFFAVTPEFGRQGKERALQLWTGVTRTKAETDEARTASDLISLLEGNDEST